VDLHIYGTLQGLSRQSKHAFRVGTRAACQRDESFPKAPGPLVSNGAGLRGVCNLVNLGGLEFGRSEAAGSTGGLVLVAKAQKFLVLSFPYVLVKTGLAKL